VTAPVGDPVLRADDVALTVDRSKGRRIFSLIVGSHEILLTEGADLAGLLPGRGPAANHGARGDQFARRDIKDLRI
jgi:hypothetical protein